MKNTKLIIFLALVIIGFSCFFLITQSNKPHHTSQYPSPFPTNSPQTTTPTTAQITQCSQDQLTATISAQGAAGNIYGTLEVTNTGKADCIITLGDTITATTSAENVVTQYKQTLPTQTVILAPLEKAYSQVHYPNGPQCQSGISPTHITFLYKTDQLSVAFQPVPPTGTLLVQSCTSPAEKTTIDIWPLSKSPITQ